MHAWISLFIIFSHLVFKIVISLLHNCNIWCEILEAVFKVSCFQSSLDLLSMYFFLWSGIAVWYIDAGIGCFKCSRVGGFSHQRLHVCGKFLLFSFWTIFLHLMECHLWADLQWIINFVWRLALIFFLIFDPFPPLSFFHFLLLSEFVTSSY